MFGSIILIIVISLAGLYIWGLSKETATASTTVPESKLQDAPDGTNKAVSTNVSDNSLTGYVSLLGLSKDKLVSTLNEEPVSVGEGGLEFEKAGIRVWFDGTSASQIFTPKKIST